MGLVFDIEQPTIPVEGSDDDYAVRRIYCVGRNYAAHAREM
ncbi:MAG: FAA hydrolase family protein, partial [Rhodospirillales bacterium]|nr:FAA hydrolase family protein [Rhodospirillales bacterium]